MFVELEHFNNIALPHALRGNKANRTQGDDNESCDVKANMVSINKSKHIVWLFADISWLSPRRPCINLRYKFSIRIATFIPTTDTNDNTNNQPK